MLCSHILLKWENTKTGKMSGDESHFRYTTLAGHDVRSTVVIILVYFSGVQYIASPGTKKKKSFGFRQEPKSALLLPAVASRKGTKNL